MEKYKARLDSIAKFLFNYETRANSFGLIGGDLARILFLFHYAEYIDSSEYFDKAIEETEWCINNLDHSQGQFDLCNGLAGFGWFIEHIEREGWIEADTNDILSEVDLLLSKKMRDAILDDNYDLLHGATGIGLYYIERLKKNLSVKEYLEELALSLTNRLGIVGEDVDVEPIWYYLEGRRVTGHNLGLAHGIPSFMSFLTKLYGAGILPGLTLRAAERLSRFMLNQQLDRSNSFAYFPSTLDCEKKERKPSRLAWCYGDLGVCCALWKVGEELKSEELKAFVRQVMISSCIRRDFETSNIVDAGFCHGSAGAAHIFRRFFDLTGEACLKDTADYWFDKTMDYGIYDDGYAGYKFFQPPAFGGWQPSINFIGGISGTGLSLLYRVSDRRPSWEEALLIS